MKIIHAARYLLLISAWALSACALVRGWEHPWPLNLVFVALWLASAGLFELAAREGRGAGA